MRIIMLKANDSVIRRVLLRQLCEQYGSDPDTLIVQELGLRHGAARIDIAVVNGHLDGFELKSDCDRLDRLPSQREIYNSVFDHITLVAGTRHLETASNIVPDWWGIAVAEVAGDESVNV